MLPEIEAILHDALTLAGFAPRGKSFVHTCDYRQIALIALGGRMSQPGQKCFAVCFRHTFLRDLEQELPTDFPPEPSNYPVKLAPNELATLDIKTWVYRSDLLRFPFGYVSSVSQANQFVRNVTTMLMPWASAITPEMLHQQISLHGTNGYIERIWMEDYTAQNAG